MSIALQIGGLIAGTNTVANAPRLILGRKI
jgi:hypothetical protein